MTTFTYHVILNPVDLGVRLVRRPHLIEVVLDPVHPQDTNFLERPPSNALRELPVPGADRLPTISLLHLGVEPLVGEHLGGSDDGETCRVATLEGGHETKLRAGGEELGGVDAVGLVLRVVAVGRVGGPEDGVQEVALAEDVADAAREGDELLGLAIGCEVGVDIVSGRARGRNEEDVVLLGGGGGVVVEVVNHEAGAVGWEDDVELGEEGDDGGGDGVVGGESDKNISVRIHEVDEVVGRQVRSKAWSAVLVELVR